MSKLLGKVPFLRVLIPIITGIGVAYFFPNRNLGIISMVAGSVILLVSFIPQFRSIFRRLPTDFFGFFLIFFGFTVFQYALLVQKSTFDFAPQPTFYSGVVLDIPLQKANSIQLSVKLNDAKQHKIIVYVEDTWEANYIRPGANIILNAQLQPFKNLGNPNDFDYKRYMIVKGFAASGYVSSQNWYIKGYRQSFYTRSQALRGKILDFYRLLELNATQFSLLSALTLGYKADLTEEVQNAFRVSGTAHVLAVSGLHVGIVFFIIHSLLLFLGKSRKSTLIRFVGVILLLWVYVYLTGLSVSVIRAAIMLTTYSFGKIFYRKGFSYNTLAAAAALILLANPLKFFEIGFQLSFASVFAILYFKPKLDKLYQPSQKRIKAVWNLFTLSLAAQLGVFPLTLLYFGTFPSYFFITNLLVVPLVGVIMYAAIPFFVVGALKVSGIAFITPIFAVVRFIFQQLINLLYGIVRFFEKLPLAQLSDFYLSVWETILLFIILFAFTLAFESKKIKYAIVASACFWLLLLGTTQSLLRPTEDELLVYNHPGETEIVYFAHRTSTKWNPQNGIIPHPTQKILFFEKNEFSNLFAPQPIPIDVLILAKDKTFSLKKLHFFFQPKWIVLDGSLPRNTKRRLKEEAKELSVSVHDVTEKGAFSLKM